MNFRFFLLIFLLVHSLSGLAPPLAAQNLGWALDPHAGINGAMLQPASTVANPHDWDLNLAAFSLDVANNYAFFRQASGLGLLRDLRSTERVAIDDTEFAVGIGSKTYQYDFPTHQRRIFARVAADVLGPALSVQLGEYTRVGVFTRLRAVASTRDLDPVLGYYAYEAQPRGIPIPAGTIYAAGAAWGEAGIHLARAIPLADGELRVGANLRRLFPAEGASLFNPEDGRLIRQENNDSLVVVNARTDLSLTDGLRSSNANFTSKGRGWGTDLGIQYAWGYNPSGGYRYVLGLAVLDLGSLRFGGNAESHRFENQGEVLLIGDDYSFTTPESIDTALQQLSQVVYGSPTQSLVGDAFTVGLPAALSLQFALRPVQEVQLALAYRGDLPLREQQLSSGSSLTLAAHYSKWWYGGGLTAAWQDGAGFNVGFQLRGGPVFLGTDRLLGTVLPAARLQSGGFFLGLRIHDFGGKGRRGGGGKSRGRSGGSSGRVKCYEF
ncbi:DUF5723 family protein [Neolewinella lacunae]|uniref:DUF5723 domain-containing protein n=1 Tax=Neolewinella lacunae TaxID=1517758 RepID=A0A923PNW9_9BACT|nr:DUF5723 family protein [Neolewinella lacunae]MBC6995885.1 hypothetical protein [Neolewinella lacunae]MDN3636423.1 DUF5723 family protein [Neolewinella lacunae]